MSHAFGCQLWLLKRGAIDNRFGIEHNQISLESNANHTAVSQLESLRGKRRHLADSFRQRQPVILTNISPAGDHAASTLSIPSFPAVTFLINSPVWIFHHLSS